MREVACERCGRLTACYYRERRWVCISCQDGLRLAERLLLRLVAARGIEGDPLVEEILETLRVTRRDYYGRSATI